jgi:hypothetical protein
MYETYDKAIVGKHVQSPPKNPRDQKQPRIEEDDTKPPSIVTLKKI